jgi:hypothetical protein
VFGLIENPRLLPGLTIFLGIYSVVTFMIGTIAFATQGGFARDNSFGDTLITLGIGFWGLPVLGMFEKAGLASHSDYLNLVVVPFAFNLFLFAGLFYFHRSRERKHQAEFPGVSADIVQQLLREDMSRFKPTAQAFHYVVIALDDTDPDAVPSLLDRTATIFLEHAKGPVPDCTASVVVGYVGVLPIFEDPLEEGASAYDPHSVCRRTVEAVLAELGNKVRIGYGSAKGLHGWMPFGTRIEFGGVIPGFSNVLTRVLAAEPGTAVEVMSEPE